MSRRADVVVVAPLDEELEPFLRRIDAERAESLPHGRVYRGLWVGRRVVAAVVGDGAGRAARSLECLFERYPATMTLMIGIAGGLSPDLRQGDLVRASRLLDLSSGKDPVEWPVPGGDELPGADGLPGVEGLAVCVERILGLAEQKAALWRRLGEPRRAVIDLESATLVRLVEAVAADWAILRAVIDPQDEDLPLDFAAASDAEGHVERGRVLRQLVARPMAIGEVLELRRRVARCAEVLAVAACRWIAPVAEAGAEPGGVDKGDILL